MTSPPAGRVVLNVLSNWGGQAVSILLGLLVAPFVVGTLGNSAYGVWMLVVSVAGYLGLMDLGVRGAVTRYVARFAAARDDEAASRVVSSAVQIFAAMGGVAVLVSAALALLAVGQFGISEDQRTTARLVLVLAGLNVGVSLVSGAYSGVVAALQRLDLLNLADVTTGVIRTGATVLALVAGQGIVAMAVIQLVVSAVRGLWLAALCRRLYPALRVQFRAVSRPDVRLIFSFSFFSFLIHVSGQVINYTDAIVIATFLPISLLTFFAIASGLVEQARSLISSVSHTTSPMASSLDGAGEHARVQTLLVRSSRFSMMILLPVAVTFLLRGASFIGLWMGPSYRDLSGEVLAILALPLLFRAGAHGVGGIMLGLGKHRPIVPAMLAEAAANLALSVALVPSMGIAGVAWGTAIPSLVSSIFFWPWYVRKAVGIPVASYVAAVWLRPWLAVVPFAVGTYAMERRWPAAALPVFFAQVGVCLLLAMAANWWVCLSESERETLVAWARRRLRRQPMESLPGGNPS